MKTSRAKTSGAMLAFAVLFGATLAAQAGGVRREPPLSLLPKYQQECASCHVAYPPGMLPTESWRRVMSGLSRHFGADASMDASSMQEISAWLAANAGTYRRVREAPPEDRITRSAWFTRKHDEVSTATWKRPAVKSPANCTACHAQADQGDFNEHNIRIPR
jgi:Dihaem cytochrome c